MWEINPKIVVRIAIGEFDIFHIIDIYHFNFPSNLSGNKLPNRLNTVNMDWKIF